MDSKSENLEHSLEKKIDVNVTDYGSNNAKKGAIMLKN